MIEYIGEVIKDNKLFNEESIVICGGGRIGARVVKYLESIRKSGSIKKICDIDRNKHGKKLGDTAICSYEELMTDSHKTEYCYVISTLAVSEVMELLVRNGAKKIHIVR